MLTGFSQIREKRRFRSPPTGSSVLSVNERQTESVEVAEVRQAATPLSGLERQPIDVDREGREAVREGASLQG